MLIDKYIRDKKSFYELAGKNNYLKKYIEKNNYYTYTEQPKQLVKKPKNNK